MNQSQQIVEALSEFSTVVIAKGKAYQAVRGGGGIEVQNIKTKKSAFLQGEDANQLEDDLDKAKNARQVDDVLSEFEHILESMAEADKVQVGDEVKINFAKAKALLSSDFASPHVMKIMRQTQKAGGGSVTVYKIMGTDAMVAGEHAALMGTVRVPIEAMKIVKPYKG